MIKTVDLKKTYISRDKEVYALKGIDLTVEKGDFVSIMGPSGSGKSTLLSILGCLDNACQGEYYLDGIDVKKLKDRKRAELRNRVIGFVFQSFFLMPRLSAIENIELPMLYSGLSPKERHKKAKWLLESVVLLDRADHFPNELSGGQCQRIAIARALANDPELILADEPTGNLDGESSEIIMDIFNLLHDQGKTIVLITHDEKIAKKADRFMVIQNGVIKEA